MRFDLKTCADNEPMTSDPFFVWLDANIPRTSHVKSVDILKGYLSSVGFVVGKDALSERDFTHLKYVLEHWHRVTPYGKPMLINEAFPMDGPYYVKGLRGKRMASTMLIDMLKNAGWIYAPTPDNVYFEILDGKVYAMGRQIITSRLLCEVL